MASTIRQTIRDDSLVSKDVNSSQISIARIDGEIESNNKDRFVDPQTNIGNSMIRETQVEIRI